MKIRHYLIALLLVPYLAFGTVNSNQTSVHHSVNNAEAASPQKHEESARELYQFKELEYDQLRDLAISILKKYPPTKSFYLGIGRSPTPIMAFYKALGISSTGVPLTKFRYSTTVRLLDSKEEKILFTHFDNYLPTAKELDGKNLLLIDKTQSGKSLVAAKRYIEKYYRSKNIKIGGIEMLGIYDNQYVLPKEKQPFFHTYFNEKNSVSINNYPLLVEYFDSTDYDNYAPYGGFDIRAYTDEKNPKPVTKLKKNNKFASLIKSFSKEIANDPKMKPISNQIFELERNLKKSKEKVIAKCISQCQTEDYKDRYKSNPTLKVESRFPSVKIALLDKKEKTIYYATLNSGRIVNMEHEAKIGEKVKVIPSWARGFKKYDRNIEIDTVWTVIKTSYIWCELKKTDIEKDVLASKLINSTKGYKFINVRPCTQ